jgi:hypothetical protein
VSPFDYLSVLLSIILGLGITQLLTGVGRLIQARGRVRVYWPTLVWVGVLLVIHVQTWWTTFELRGREEWNFFVFLVVLLQPIGLYLLSALVLPDFGETGNPDEELVDMRANFLANAGWFYGISLSLLAVSVGKDLALDGELPETPNLLAHATFFALWLTPIVVRREWVHKVIAPTMAGLFALYVAVLFARLR